MIFAGDLALVLALAMIQSLMNSWFVIPTKKKILSHIKYMMLFWNIFFMYKSSNLWLLYDYLIFVIILKETYCEMLDKYRSDLARPFDEATTFLNNMQTQLNNLCKGTTVTYNTGTVLTLVTVLYLWVIVLCMGFIIFMSHLNFIMIIYFARVI